MLKKSLFSPAQPRRAETRLFPCVVLASFRSSTYPTWRTSCLGSLGRAGEKSDASGLHSLRPCRTALLNILGEIGGRDGPLRIEDANDLGRVEEHRIETGIGRMAEVVVAHVG